jgi:hypothetical protein
MDFLSHELLDQRNQSHRGASGKIGEGNLLDICSRRNVVGRDKQ